MHEPQDFAQRLARLMAGENHVRHRDRAGVDERVARYAALALQLDDRVERTAGRLAANALPQPVADLAERERQREDLGDALDGEGRIAIAAACQLAVRVDHGDAESVWIDMGELGNIIRDRAAIRSLPHLFGDFFYDAIKLRHKAEALPSAAARERNFYAVHGLVLLDRNQESFRRIRLTCCNAHMRFDGVPFLSARGASAWVTRCRRISIRRRRRRVRPIARLNRSKAKSFRRRRSWRLFPIIFPRISAARRSRRWRWIAVAVLIGAGAAGGGIYWKYFRPPPWPAGIVFSNGRVEAEEIDIDAKFAERVAQLLVDEGDVVSPGQIVARMDIRDVQASLNRAESQVQEAQETFDEAKANVGDRQRS